MLYITLHSTLDFITTIKIKQIQLKKTSHIKVYVDDLIFMRIMCYDFTMLEKQSVIFMQFILLMGFEHKAKI
ncbi:MAG: hypothetical protein ACJARD_000505 [Alphaproteobacteria bacterium]|jgi:hypothetical protein